jgi:hypothetical protein
MNPEPPVETASLARRPRESERWVMLDWKDGVQSLHADILAQAMRPAEARSQPTDPAVRTTTVGLR